MSYGAYFPDPKSHIASHIGDWAVALRQPYTPRTLVDAIDPQLLEGSVGRNRGDESNSNEELLEHLDLQGHSMEGEQRSTVCQAMLCYIFPHAEKHRTHRHRCRSGHALHELSL